MTSSSVGDATEEEHDSLSSAPRRTPVGRLARLSERRMPPKRAACGARGAWPAASCEFPPARLDVEISESCLQENLTAAQTMIVSLKNLGVRVSLDDFGTGFTSLTQLRTLPFDRVKIDRSFVGELRKVAEAAPELDFDRADRDHIVGTLVSLGKGLQIPVTAEGVEDNSILETLRTMGDMKGQGYLYGKPEDAAAVMKRLKQLDMLSNMPGAQPEGMERKSA